MAAPIVEIEVRWRPVNTDLWRNQNFPPDAGVITLTGLMRGVEYEGHARSLGPDGINSHWVPITFVVASESTTPLDRITLDLDIEAGKVVVDCTLSKFRLTLNKNVSDWQFANVPPATSITIEAEQWTPGGFTIAWPAHVVPISGRAHVMTPTVGAVDLITLSTTDGGKTWRLSAGQPEPDSTSGTVLGVTLSPSPATATASTDGVTASAPSVSVTATTANGTAPITFAWVRTDSAGGTDFTIANGTTATPTFSIPSGTTAYNATQAWRCTATDANSATASASADVTLARTVSGGLKISISPSPAKKAHVTDPKIAVSAAISGGSGPRTIRWRRIDGNGGSNFNCTAPTLADTTFSMGAGALPDQRTQVWRCDVSDASGSVFADVTVDLERFGTV